MKKVFQWCCPIVFSIVSFLVFYISIIIIDEFIETEGYGGIGIAALVVFVWILIAIPIYCYFYRKLVRNERLKLLFALYNPLVISCSYTLPFLISSGGDDIVIISQIAIVLFIWVATWSFEPSVTQSKLDKNKDVDNLNITQK